MKPVVQTGTSPVTAGRHRTEQQGRAGGTRAGCCLPGPAPMGARGGTGRAQRRGGTRIGRCWVGSPCPNPCTPIAVAPWGPSRPCTRVCAVVVGGREMVALSPLRDRGAAARAHSAGRTGVRVLGESGDGDSQVGNKPSVKRTLSALVSGGAPKGCVGGSRTVLGWPQGFLPAQSGNFGLHKAAAGGDLRSPVLTRGGEGAEDRRALSPQPFWLPSALHQGGSPGLRTPGQGKQRSPAQCPPPQFSISPPDP